MNPSTDAPEHLSPGAGAALLHVARQALAQHLKIGDLPRSGPAEPAAELSLERAAFVSLHTERDLRGCVGIMVPRGPLAEVVADLALAAATQDGRFAPLEARDWPSLSIEISVLSSLALLPSLADLEIGLHGLLVGLGARSGVFLPQVATEQGWTREMLLSRSCAKAGLAADRWKSWARGDDTELRVETFTTQVLREH